MSRPIVIVESPFAGKGTTIIEVAADAARKLRYLRACLRDSILRGEAPFASHGLYTQEGVLRDEDPEERKLGIEVGFEFRRVAKLTAVYVDLGYSSGMRDGIEHAIAIQCPIQERWLGAGWDQ